MKSAGSWPTFESTFLGEIACALQMRRKAIKHMVRSYSCERLREVSEDGEFEKLEMVFEFPRPHPIRISFLCWTDHWLWLDIRQPSKSGWLFEWQHEGRVGKAGPAAVANSLLQTLKYPYGQGIESTGPFLDKQWEVIAINGPRGEVT